jgi:hypothetical protein
MYADRPVPRPHSIRNQIWLRDRVRTLNLAVNRSLHPFRNGGPNSLGRTAYHDLAGFIVGVAVRNRGNDRLTAVSTRGVYPNTLLLLQDGSTSWTHKNARNRVLYSAAALAAQRHSVSPLARALIEDGAREG